MANFKDTVPLVFNGITVVGLTRAYTVLDAAVQRHTIGVAIDPSIYIPLACAVYSIASAILSHRANRKFAEIHPDTSTIAPTAILAWLTAGCLALMCFFAVRIETITLWFAAYGLLCLVNSAWNWCSVPKGERLPHVSINAALGVLLLALIAIQKDFVLPRDKVLLHVALIAIVFITLLKRFFKRFEPATQ